MDDDVQDDIDIYADLSFESHGEDENNQEVSITLGYKISIFYLFLPIISIQLCI